MTLSTRITDAAIYFLAKLFIPQQSQLLSDLKITKLISSWSFLSDLQLLLAIILRHLFSSIRLCRVSSSQSRRLICSRAGLSARTLARSLTITGSTSIIPDLTTAALLYSNLKVQIEHTLSLRSVKTLNKLGDSYGLSGLSFLSHMLSHL